MHKIINLLKKFLIIFVLSYVVFCLMVYFKQEWFFYNPTNAASDIERARHNDYPAERVDYKSADGTDLFAWYTKPKAGKKIIVFMHGNSYNIEKFYIKLIPLQQAGYGTFLPEYRGFGGVAGKIAQKNLTADAIAAIEYLYKEGYQNEDIIVYGMSLGSHMATNSVYTLGQDNQFAGLILEVPFTSLIDVARSHVSFPLPLDYIMRDKYDNVSKITHIHTPLLIMGAGRDATVPVNLAKELYARAEQPKKILIYEDGEHSNLYDFKNYQDILSWLKANEKN